MPYGINVCVYKMFTDMYETLKQRWSLQFLFIMYNSGNILFDRLATKDIYSSKTYSLVFGLSQKSYSGK